MKRSLKIIENVGKSVKASSTGHHLGIWSEVLNDLDDWFFFFILSGHNWRVWRDSDVDTGALLHLSFYDSLILLSCSLLRRWTRLYIFLELSHKLGNRMHYSLVSWSLNQPWGLCKMKGGIYKCNGNAM